MEPIVIRAKGFMRLGLERRQLPEGAEVAVHAGGHRSHRIFLSVCVHVINKMEGDLGGGGSQLIIEEGAAY